MIISTMLRTNKEASLGKIKLDRSIRHNNTARMVAKQNLLVTFRNYASVL